MSDGNEGLRAAERKVEKASAELDRLQLMAKMCEKEGLTYASLTDSQLGPMLVTYQHKPIGEVHTTGPSALQNWHAQRYQADGSLGDSYGPYVTARAAAASLIPGHAKDEPRTAGAG